MTLRNPQRPGLTFVPTANRCTHQRADGQRCEGPRVKGRARCRWHPAGPGSKALKVALKTRETVEA